MKRQMTQMLLAGALSACSGSPSSTPASTCATPSTSDPASFAVAPTSCAYTCPVTTCSEQATPYVCPSLGDWGCIPHDDVCAGWDGGTPAVTQGKCSASTPSGEAVKYAGTDPNNAAVLILPDGRRMSPAGSYWEFAETDLIGGLTTAAIAIPGTNFVLTVDTGAGDHAVRAIDVTKIGAGNPVVSYVKFAPPATLNSGITYLAPNIVLVATDDGVIQALSLDTLTGALALDAAHTITLPPSTNSSGDPANWYASGVAASPDGTRLVVTGVTEDNLLVYDLTPGASYGQKLGQVGLGQSETYGVAFDPNDLNGQYAYVSMWAGSAVLEVDVSQPTTPRVARTFATQMDPAGVAFLDWRWMAVANDLGETLSLIDRAAGTVTEVPVDVGTPGHGLDVSDVAYDATTGRLYATLSGINAVGAWSVDTTTAPPTVVPLGQLPTAWWAGGLVTMPDGSVVVASMRGEGTGNTLVHWDIGNSDISDHMRGGIQRIPTPTAAELTSGQASVAASLAVNAQPGAPVVACPSGADDFPIPATNSEGASPVIQHVFLFVRENKDFDGLFGDFPTVNGDPSLTLKTVSGEMDRIWTNLRTLARTFTVSDNYYTDAEYSTQGHVWTTYGRTNDFNERTWAVSGNGRDARSIPGGGVVPVGQPVEGSLFDWLGRNGVAYDILGEIDGAPLVAPGAVSPFDDSYPGGIIQNIGFSDSEKACHIAGRARVLCNLHSFVYATLPNDHTFGVSPTNPAPETFCAVNDEATGIAVDAISHSPLWASSVIFITEDDPSQGGEHVDYHRAPLVVVSPWAKRGYVSKTHADVASLHKFIAHIFGKPYPNVEVANAGLPLDIFTSTPDFTPYTYAKRTLPLACGDESTLAEQTLTASWNFDSPDEQPGLDAQVTRWMRGVQLKELTPRLRAQIEARVLERSSPAEPRPQPSPDFGGDR